MKTLSHYQLVGNLKALGWGSQWFVPRRGEGDHKHETYLVFNPATRKDIEADLDSGDVSYWESLLNQLVAQLRKKGFTVRWESFVDLIPDYPWTAYSYDKETGERIAHVKVGPARLYQTIAHRHHSGLSAPWVVTVDAEYTY